MSRGLTDRSNIKEEVIKIDANTAVRYKVVEEKIDLKSLKDSITAWENMQEPTEKELIELGKAYHPYYLSRDTELPILRQRIKELEGV